MGPSQCARSRNLRSVAEKTVYTMAQNREMPAVRGHRRFKRTDLDQSIDLNAGARDDKVRGNV